MLYQQTQPVRGAAQATNAFWRIFRSNNMVVDNSLIGSFYAKQTIGYKVEGAFPIHGNDWDWECLTRRKRCLHTAKIVKLIVNSRLIGNVMDINTMGMEPLIRLQNLSAPHKFTSACLFVCRVPRPNLRT